MAGLFITFEGIEGTGKSTQIAMLAQHLADLRLPFVVTREPGGTDIGNQIRKILLDPAHTMLVPTTELLLYAASRAQHIAQVIRPALLRGEFVLCDRYVDATVAYQGFGRGLDRALIATLNAIATDGLLPDRTLLLDASVDTGLGRARGRNTSAGLQHESRFENEQLAFHEKIRVGYHILAREQPERFVLIDAARSIDDVQRAIRDHIDALLDARGMAQ